MLRVEDHGHLPYPEAHNLQQTLLKARVLDQVPDTLVLVEHPPVITLGRGFEPQNLKDPGAVPVIEVERGGDATWHGPGQLVGYWIRKLHPGARDLHGHLRLLEELIISVSKAFGVHAGRHPGATGVWVGDRKLASLGVACRQWCTWHGFALNVDPDLEAFRSINPCGFPAGVMTSLARETGQPVSLDSVKASVRELAPAVLR